MDTSPNIQHESSSKKQISNRTAVSRSLFIVGSIVLIGGLLAYIIPEMSVPPGSGDTSAAWVAGFTELFCAIPLFILGTILLIIAAITYSKKSK